MNATTRRHAPIALLILASALALTACASTGTTATTTGTPPPLFASSAAPVAATTTAPAPAPSATPASSQICTSHACIVSDVEKSLVGLVAKDESVITKAVCYKSTVKANPGDTYTVSCDVTYSDGTVYSGDATLLVAKDQIAWEPTGQVS